MFFTILLYNTAQLYYSILYLLMLHYHTKPYDTILKKRTLTIYMLVIYSHMATHFYTFLFDDYFNVKYCRGSVSPRVLYASV